MAPPAVADPRARARRPSALASSRPIASPSPNPAWPPVSRPRLKRSKMSVPLLERHARARRRTRSASARSAVAELDPDLGAFGADADGVLEQDPQDPGDAAGVAERPHGSSAISSTDARSRARGPELELREHGAAQLARTRPARSAVRPRRRSAERSSRSAASRPRRRDCARARAEQRAARPRDPGPGRRGRRRAARASPPATSAACAARAKRWRRTHAGPPPAAGAGGP